MYIVNYININIYIYTFILLSSLLLQRPWRKKKYASPTWTVLTLPGEPPCVMTSWSDIWWWPTNNLLETTQTLCAHTNDCQIMPKKRTHTHWWYPLLQFDSNALLNCQIRFDGFQAFGFSSHIHEFTKSSYIHLQFCVVLNFMWQHQVKGLMHFYMYLYVFMISIILLDTTSKPTS